MSNIDKMSFENAQIKQTFYDFTHNHTNNNYYDYEPNFYKSNSYPQNNNYYDSYKTNDYESDTFLNQNNENYFSTQKQFTNELNECIELKQKELTLEGSYECVPRECAGFYWVSKLTIKNTYISELKNLPPNLTSLHCENNNIVVLDGLSIPASVTDLTITSCNTTTIINLKNGIVNLTLESNNLRSFTGCTIPESVKMLNIATNSMFYLLMGLPSGLKHLNINDTNVQNIDNLNDNLEILETCHCKIPIVNKLPKKLKIWKSFSSQIQKITCDFPKKIEHIDLYKNALTSVPEFPDTVVYGDLNSNDLEMLPLVPSIIEEFDVRNNNRLNYEMLKNVALHLSNCKFEYDDTNKRKNAMIPAICNDYSESNPNYIVLKKVFAV